MKKIFLLGITIILITVLCVLFVRSRQIQQINPNVSASPSPKTALATKTILIGDKTLRAEFATTPAEWQLGLGNRKQLGANSGMIFIFPKAEIQNFWMKDTLIPLDIIWVNNKRVIGMAHMFPEPGVPDTALKHYLSPIPADAVIETSVDWTTNNKIKIGDLVEY